MNDEPPPWRLAQIANQGQEVYEIMNPESVQVITAITDYLSSFQFFALVVIYLGYRTFIRWRRW